MKNKHLIPLLTISALGLGSANAAVIFSESFESATLANTRVGAAGVNGATYTGSESWQVASNGAADDNETSWAVGTSLGWTGNDASGNQYLFSDSTGSALGGDSSVFRSYGWNTNNDDILTVTFEFAFQPEDDGNGNWGAFVMSSNAALGNSVETVAGSGDQQVHIRFNRDGDVTLQDNALIGTNNVVFTNGLAALNTFSLTYNGSASAYNGIASGNASLTINGSLIDGNFDVGHSSNTNGPVILDYMEFRAFGGLGDDGTTPYQAYFDDVAVTAVPEPSTYALLAGFGALALVMIRRRMR